MPPASAAASLERAHSRIQEALAKWQAADLERVGKSCQLLVEAAADLRVFENAARCGAVTPTPEIYSTILEVKRKVARVTRLVDACVAFHRGLAARTSDTPPVYNAGGYIAEESSCLESEVQA